MHSEMNEESVCNICDGFFEIKAELKNETLVQNRARN